MQGRILVNCLGFTQLLVGRETDYLQSNPFFFAIQACFLKTTAHQYSDYAEYNVEQKSQCLCSSISVSFQFNLLFSST